MVGILVFTKEEVEIINDFKQDRDMIRVAFLKDHSGVKNARGGKQFHWWLGLLNWTRVVTGRKEKSVHTGDT